MKIQVDAARVTIQARFTRQGSLLDYTVEAGTDGVDVHLDVDSSESPERIAGLLRNAEAGCYVIQSLRKPTEVNSSFTLNGTAIMPKAPD